MTPLVSDMEHCEQTYSLQLQGSQIFNDMGASYLIQSMSVTYFSVKCPVACLEYLSMD